MIGDMKAFEGAWARYWAGRSEGTGGMGRSRGLIHLADSPAYPLARTVRMPDGHGYETGALSFRMSGLTLDGLGELEPGSCTEHRQGPALSLGLVLSHLVLAGGYSLEVKPDPIIENDSAGNLMELPPEALRPTVAGADPADPVTDPQTEAWLDQARDQRTTLSQTSNGQSLLGLFDQHNETFNATFQNPALATVWSNGGATKAMASDTSDAVSNNTVVNDSKKAYTSANGPISYNGNAFVQQLNVAVTCVYTDPNFSDENGPDMTSDYWAAAKAALSFGQGVSTETNNTKNTVNEMKPADVHATVQNATNGLPAVTDDDLNQIIANSPAPGGEADPVDLGWIVIDEDDRKRIRHLYEATMKQRAEDANIVGQPLFSGACEARIDGVGVRIELERAGEAGGYRARSTQVVLPAFELDIDDSGWVGDAGEIARGRLDRMYFIRSLLHDAISAGLEEALADAAVATFDAASTDNLGSTGVEKGDAP